MLVNGGDGDWANYYCVDHAPWKTIHWHLASNVRQLSPIGRVGLSLGLLKQVYSTRKSLDLLNRTASTFFDRCRHALAHDIVLTICQITDPAKLHGKSNLTLKQMLLRMKEAGECDRDLVARLEEQLHKVDKAVESFREVRNKRLAHLDLEVNLGLDVLSTVPPGQTPAPDVTGQNVEDALYQIRLFMWEAKHAPGQPQPKPYQLPQKIPGDGDELIRKLELLDDQGLLK